MTEVTRHEPGAFSWPELATTDSAGAKTFYAGLFGWTHTDSAAGPDMVYTRLQKKGKDVGGLYTMRPDQKGMPPNWGAYFTVVSADDGAKRAVEAGGKVLMEPFDVKEHGRMAVIQDPQGVFFSLWEPRGHIGAERIDEPGAPCWVELETTDTDSAGKFYTGLFGWKTKAGGDYTEFYLGAKPIGGMMKIPKEWGPVPPHWLVYFMVADTDASVETGKKLGASVTVPPTDIEKVGRFAALRDPQGATFAVFRPDPAFRA